MAKRVDQALRAQAPLTVAQAAVRLNQSMDYVSRLCRNGKLPGAYRSAPGCKRGVWRIPLSAIESYERSLQSATSGTRAS